MELLKSQKLSFSFIPVLKGLKKIKINILKQF